MKTWCAYHAPCLQHGNYALRRCVTCTTGSAVVRSSYDCALLHPQCYHWMFSMPCLPACVQGIQQPLGHLHENGSAAARHAGCCADTLCSSTAAGLSQLMITDMFRPRNTLCRKPRQLSDAWNSSDQAAWKEDVLQERPPVEATAVAL
jgi:hypothetical protein